MFLMPDPIPDLAGVVGDWIYLEPLASFVVVYFATWSFRVYTFSWAEPLWDKVFLSFPESLDSWKYELDKS